MYIDQIPLLKKALATGLLGWEAQRLMLPLKTDKYQEPHTNSKQAGVSVILYPDVEGVIQAVFIKRPAHPLDKHSGQISFAGGQKEQSDVDLQATALREMEEELGIARGEAQVLGALTSMYVYVSDFYVEPYVVYLDDRPQYLLQASEVDYVIEIPLTRLINQSSVTTDIFVRNTTLKDVPYYDLNGDVLWGATAMITSELIEMVRRL